mmetsp:Transcript_9775/g.18899  ORF Transcript_9775/g.18899 Transcript_9775/m.18899 type:complete len:237 (+) Transcript_9775:56-766(+)|eukprot:CAMPEP_0172728452 /NCGR_PEP_ID=MMETSP1074-20121228/92249_1 /TAXON_ID=2916 /ORGANISM="Ceratium fusus, Strain PA161109" /LENGTH=236 /DNA_ID=CAMNT_0013555701 /DNA_START=50 /DNA_END=760 /DNA_ORIENTATION=-
MTFQAGEPFMACRLQDMRGCRRLRRRRGGTGRRGTQRASSKAPTVFSGIAEAWPRGASDPEHNHELAKERNVKVPAGQEFDQAKTIEEKFDCVDNAHGTKGEADPVVTVPALDKDEAAAAAARVLLARIRSRVAGKACSGLLALLQAAEFGCTATLAPWNFPAKQTSEPPGLGKTHHQRRVTFDLDASTQHDVIPYSEVYGLHPRDFVFDRHFAFVPAEGPFGFVGLPTNDDTDEE